jgi:sodium/potassium-transporting ATPase subunit alpha
MSPSRAAQGRRKAPQLDLAKLDGWDRAQLFEALDSGPHGLTTAEAMARRARFGSNSIRFHRARSPWLMLIREFWALFPLLLLAAAVLAFIADTLSPGEGYQLIGIALLGVVILNALVSFVQNYRVEKLMLSFLDYIPKEVALLRDDERALRDAVDVVPGDILFVQEGDKISADGVFLAGERLLVDESILTGESEPVDKVVLEERVTDTSRARSGATVMRGNGRILVVATGRSTGLGAISDLSRRVEQDLTPMQLELRDFVRKITWLALGIGGFFFVVGHVIGNPFWTNLIFAIGIIVANVPEGLLPTVTLALTQSSVRMGRRNALVKQILSVETLGSTTVICTDKTGTLTRNRLHVESLFLGLETLDDLSRAAADPAVDLDAVIEVMALCNDAIVSDAAVGDVAQFHGDPTETALATFVEAHGGYLAWRERFARIGGQPFDAETKLMSVISRARDGALRMSVKGAPEMVIERCDQLLVEGRWRRTTSEDRARLLEQADRYARQGLRVLALASRAVDGEGEAIEQLRFIALVALVDPPRPEVPAAVAACGSAGIRIIVMSGDKGETVAYIARRLGIVRHPRIIEGKELAELSSDALAAALRDEEVVFARIAPEQKLDIVDALKAMGEVVAMTGDGVNDAPALKRADIGVAMGKRGTDVAKEASDIILLDDNFATIVEAVKEGRAVYENIRKFITYILTSNIPEILPFVAYVLWPIPLPITVVQILAIDLITDILPAIGLGNEPPEDDVMRRPPRRRDEHLVSARTFLRSYAIIGPLEALLAFAVFFAVLADGGWQWGTELAFDAPLYLRAAGAFLATIIFCQVGNVMACRSARLSSLPHLLRLNAWIVGGIVVEVLFVAAITELPWLHLIFSANPLPGWVWVLLISAPLVVFFVEELRKWLVRRGAHWLAA